MCKWSNDYFISPKPTSWINSSTVFAIIIPHPWPLNISTKTSITLKANLFLVWFSNDENRADAFEQRIWFSFTGCPWWLGTLRDLIRPARPPWLDGNKQLWLEAGNWSKTCPSIKRDAGSSQPAVAPTSHFPYHRVVYTAQRFCLCCSTALRPGLSWRISTGWTDSTAGFSNQRSIYTGGSLALTQRHVAWRVKPLRHASQLVV